MKLTRLVLVFLSTIALVSCSSSTKEGEVGADRGQFFLVSGSEIEKMSAQAYEQTLAEAAKKGTLDRDPAQLRRVQEIARRIVPHTKVFRTDAPSWKWEVHVLTSKEINAYCMPGGKIAFYTGIIDTLKLTDAEIAAIMGHEIAHALREHGRERMSEAVLQTLGVQVLVATGTVDAKYAGALAALTNVVVGLPHSRGQESEADDIGIELMARAGYDPHAGVTLWKKMAAQSGGKAPPEMLSTHPASESRIRRIEELIPKVMPLYKRAGGEGQSAH